MKKLLKRIPGVTSAYDFVLITTRLVRRGFAALLLNLVLWPLEVFSPIRLCVLSGMDRFGQQAAFLDVHLRRRALGLQPKGKLIFLYRSVANQELDRFYSRYVCRITNPVLARVAEWAAPWLPTRFVVPNLFKSYGAYEYSVAPAVVGLDDEEERRGRMALEQLGLGPDDWFVTFHARDAAYIDLSYHDYRNAKIDNCLAAAEWVVAQGGWALRLGAAVEKSLPADRHPRIIDYAVDHRTEFLDVFLPAKNLFHIGNSSGISFLPIVFGRPCGIANMAPLACFGPGRDTLWMPKLVRDTRGGRILSFAEAHQRGLFSVDGPLFLIATYGDLGLELVENSSEDILGLCQDMFDLINGAQTRSEVKSLQELYRERYLSHLPDYRYSAPLAPSFALRYRHLIEA